MKKIGILIFILAVILGYLAANLTSYGNVSGYIPQFSFNFGKVKGSGNVVSEQKNIRDFTAVSASGVFKVDITAGSDFSVVIKADDNIMPLITTEVINGELRLATSKGIKNSTRMYARITMPQIDGIKTSGAVKAKVENVNSADLNIKTSGVSRVDVSGTAKEVVFRSSGTSKINAEMLKSEDAELRSSGVSKIDISVSKSLTATSSGASHIKYYGEPGNVNPKTSGTSKITAN